MTPAKYPPGVADRLPTHPKANQKTFPLSGEVKTADGTLSQSRGQGISIPPKGDANGKTHHEGDDTPPQPGQLPRTRGP